MQRLFESCDVQEERSWLPVIVQTRTHSLRIAPVAYDCVKFILIRSGSSILISEFGQRLVRADDLIVLCATTLCGAIPAPTVSVSTAYVDPDYLLDQVLWSHADQLADRLAAESFVEEAHFYRAQVFKLPTDVARRVAHILDEIEATEQSDTDPFYRMQAHFSILLRLLGRLMPLNIKAPSKTHVFRTGQQLGSRARYSPMRKEALKLERELQANLSHRWTVLEMAETVHLSPRHLTRVFIDSLGRTPISYLRMLRAKEMSRLLRATDMTIADAGRTVGWTSRSHARESFIACIGMSPAEYRGRFGGRETDAWYRQTDEIVHQVS